MSGKSQVYILKTEDRNHGIPKLMEKFSTEKWSGDKIALKANYNSSDDYPASTHIETMRNIVSELKKYSPAKLTLAERSGMGNTRSVLEKRGVFSLSEELGFETLVLDELDKTGWVKISGAENHWMKGFYMPKLVLDADRIVETCCLKTHRFGGHFTLSLKNFVGWVAKNVPGDRYNYMAELHVSPFQRQIIAEINQHFKTDMIIMDAIKGFVTQGPDKGQIIEPNLLLASSDRVAMDAVGVAILRAYGVKGPVAKGKIFKQAQLKRAVQLNIGVSSSSEIELIGLNQDSEEDIILIEDILRNN
ncbi:MAG: hypothetical protein CVV28_03720 [Methanobacteriales archaeon HGW-Methanobacteriales-1]|jgi:uncharacterized protein (DUF362 family)|nr:MAG: hypothetical protein CVV28_03720 [Methanobacteriales archaeon HGW-Methanobacteriales-1]